MTTKTMKRSETKHTPGPWRYEPSSGDRRWGNVVDAGGHEIAAACIEGNGRLIAAAPDLLEVLRYLRDEYRGLDSHHRHSLHSTDFAHIEAIIKKAEGKTP